MKRFRPEPDLNPERPGALQHREDEPHAVPALQNRGPGNRVRVIPLKPVLKPADTEFVPGPREGVERVCPKRLHPIRVT